MNWKSRIRKLTRWRTKNGWRTTENLHGWGIFRTASFRLFIGKKGEEVAAQLAPASWIASSGSNPARLGELRSPGRARRQPPPPFSYKKAEGGCSKDPSAPWLCISAVLGEKNCFREENPSRGASVTLP